MGRKRGMRRRMSHSHCLTEYTINREPRQHEMKEKIDEWVGDIHIIVPVSTLWPAEELVSGPVSTTRPDSTPLPTARPNSGWGYELTNHSQQHETEQTKSKPATLDGQHSGVVVKNTPKIIEEGSTELVQKQ